MKADLHRQLSALAEADPAQLPRLAAELHHPNVEWRGSHPLNHVTGISALHDEVLAPMRRAFPDMERRDSIFIGGIHNGSDYVAAIGHYQANFDADWCGIPATFGVVQLRYGEVYEVVEGKIARIWCLWDLLDLIRQAGCWPMAPAVGAAIGWPAPLTNDGVALSGQDVEAGTKSLAFVLRMHAGMHEFDGKDLATMRFGDHWIENFMWYGPAGIGSARGLRRYQNHHSIPFLTAFPDRKGSESYLRFGDGPYVFTGGWASVLATHSGDGWLAMPATGKRVAMRVMDFYRVAPNGLIAENWVPIDVIDVLRQIGFDVFARLRHLRGQARESL